MLSLVMNNFFDFASNMLSIFLGKPNAPQNTDENITKIAEKSSEFQQKDTGISVLTKIQKESFEYWVRCHTSPQWLVNRCQILLELNEGKAKYQVAREQKKDIKTIRKWSKRWERSNKELSKLEDTAINDKDYRKLIIKTLSDATRTGRPLVFTAEQVVQIIAMACEVKDDSEKATSHWIWGDIVRESVNRGIVEKISISSVGRFLSEAHIKAHLTRYWLNARPEVPEQFEQEIKKICGFYREAPELFKQGVYLVSTDEKTGIQALERSHPTHPARPDKKKTKPELREHGYERHDTLCLIANFMVATGRIIAPTIGPTRKEEDFLRNIKNIVDTEPHAQWIFVADQLNTHMSESLVRYIAVQCGIEKSLGIKGKSGLLKSMATRKIFLSDPEHRIRFIYTPKHTSWMNQVEIWFSILTRRLLKRGSFRSTDHLKKRILKFIDFFNETMAKPFKWTYRGRPLTV